jgi:CheY-like chemotaxis protein
MEGSVRILIVDDHRDSAESLAMVMRKSGYEAHVAYDGLEAVNAAQQLRPDAVLLDLRLPQLDGFEACRRIRQQPGGEKVLLIAHTGLSDGDERRRVQEAGFDAHLTKPLDQSALRQLLARLS